MRRIIENFRKPEGFFGSLMVNRMNKHHSLLIKWGLSYFDFSDRMNILDIGCGGGNTVKHLLKLSPAIVCGIDYSPLCVKKSALKNHSEVLRKRCVIKLGDVQALEFRDNTFDTVIAVETIYFWSPLDKALAEIYRVLDKGGKFIIINELTNPSADSLQYYKLKKKMDLNIYTEEQLSKAVVKANFSIDNIHTKEEWLTLIATKN